MKKLLLTLLAFLILTVPAFAGSKTLKFTWQQTLPNPNDMAGWKLYASTSATGPWTLQEPIPYVTPATDYVAQSTVTVPEGQTTTLYFCMSAYDTSGNESGKSNVVSTNIDFQAPDVPFTLTILIMQ